MEFSITRKSVTTELDAQKQINKIDPDTGRRFGTITGTMGRKNTVPYALYRSYGFVNPYLANDTGFTTGDLEMLWSALKGNVGNRPLRQPWVDVYPRALRFRA